MTRRTTRLTPEDLTAEALRRAHPFQRIALESLMAHDWRVSCVSFHPRTGDRVVVMRHSKDSSIGCAVYPDGSFGRSKTPTVKWDWKRCADAATATIPDIYVRNILEKQKEHA
jgi:WD40 repeat protein